MAGGVARVNGGGGGGRVVVVVGGGGPPSEGIERWGFGKVVGMETVRVA